MAFSLDGKYVLTGSQNHTVRLWDVTTGKTVQTLNAHAGDVYGVAFSPDGQTVITAMRMAQRGYGRYTLNLRAPSLE